MDAALGDGSWALFQRLTVEAERVVSSAEMTKLDMPDVEVKASGITWGTREPAFWEEGRGAELAGTDAIGVARSRVEVILRTLTTTAIGLSQKEAVARGAAEAERKAGVIVGNALIVEPEALDLRCDIPAADFRARERGIRAEQIAEQLPGSKVAPAGPGSPGVVDLDDVATLSDATPQALGTAVAGDDTEASRADHVHAMPTAAQVGAAPTSRTLTINGVSYDLSADRTWTVTAGLTMAQIASKIVLVGDQLVVSGGEIVYLS
jgi:hypothetical protein